MTHHGSTSLFSRADILSLRIHDTVTMNGCIFGIRDVTEIRIFDENNTRLWTSMTQFVSARLHV